MYSELVPRRAAYDLRACRTFKPRWVAIIPVITALGLGAGCSRESKPPPVEKKTAQPAPTTQSKADWAEMLLRPTDSTRRTWLAEMAAWPDPLHVTLDSAGQAQVSDLTFAIDVWAFKNLDFAGDSLEGGLRASALVGATHVPSHLLMKDFSVDSVLFFLPGQDAAAARKKMFAARRKFIQGVWQVEFLLDDPAISKVDFPEGTRLKPRLFISWRGKKLIFEAPYIKYEYSQTPQPVTG